MRLEKSSLPSSLVLACSVLVLPACPGDDGPSADSGGSSTGMATTDASTSNGTTNSSADTTAGDSSSGGDPSTSGVDTTDGESSGDSTTGSMPGDCAGMSFETLTSMNNDMVTNLDVAGVVSCNQDITITATGGTVCVADDGAGGYFYTVETITLEDVPPVSCGLAEVGISNMSIVNIGDGMEVTIPMAGGAMTGNQSIQVMGDVEGTALGMAIGPTPIMMFEGVLPEGDATVGADTTVTYADDMTVIATAMPEVVAGVMVTVTLTGLDGSLTFGP